jgi:hypothetical protein
MKTKLMITVVALAAVLGAGCSSGSSSETTEPVEENPADVTIEVENRNPVVRLHTEPHELVVTCNAGLMTITPLDRRAGASTELVADCEQAIAALRTGDDTIEPARTDRPQG